MIIGTGIDIVELARIQRLIDLYGDRFLKKVYSGKELDYAFSKTKPLPSLAARFAAKEAFIKAVGHCLSVKPDWTDISVLSGSDQRPVFSFDNHLLQQLAGIQLWLSLSHEKHWAVAVVVAEK